VTLAGKPDCPICWGLGYFSYNVDPGHPQFGKVHACECRADELAAHQAQRLESLTNLLPRERQITLDTFIARGEASEAMVAAVQAFARAPYGMLTLWGGVGTGKTMALQALTNHFREAGTGAVYVIFKDLVDWIRQGNATSAAEDAVQRAERIRQVKFLAIDEIDKARMTDFAFEFRTSLLDHRYRLARENGPAQCHTVLAMNDDPAQLPDYIYDRLRWGVDDPAGGFRIVRNDDASARPAGL
jgi:DNA replication protein DnaC